MRGARSTLVLLVVFLGLAAYVYFVEMERRPASETPPNEPLFELTADEIDTLVVRTASEESSLHRTDEAWALDRPIESAADDTTVSAITSAVETADIRRVVDDGPVDLEPFGLTAPVVDLSFTADGDDAVHRLLIGNTSPTGVDRYAKLADDDRVILVSASLESTFNKSTFDLRDKTILDFETSDVDQLEIELADSTLSFEKSDNQWRLTQPWDVRADFGTVEGLVGRISSGQMVSVVTEDVEAELTDADDGEDSDPYGLAEPSITATVQAGSASATLVVGSPTETGERYARDASRSIVFGIEPSLVSDLIRDAAEYRRKDLFSFRSFNATRLEIEHGEATFVFEKTTTTGDDPGTTWTRTQPDTMEMAQGDMDDLLAKISNLRAESFIESRTDAALSVANILATVRVTYGDDDAEESVVFWRHDDATYGVNGAEPGAGVVDSRSVDDAFETLGSDAPPAP